jgi:hypothetical protein
LVRHSNILVQIVPEADAYYFLLAPPPQSAHLLFFRAAKTVYSPATVHFAGSVRYIGAMKIVQHAFLSFVLLCALCAPAYAQERAAKPSIAKNERSAVRNGLTRTPGSGSVAGVSLRDAVTLAREDTGGRVLSSKSFGGGNGAQIHQIRLLVDGERVITVVVDAKGKLRRR